MDVETLRYAPALFQDTSLHVKKLQLREKYDFFILDQGELEILLILLRFEN